MGSPVLILDTNILVHFVRSSPVWEQARDRYQLLTVEPRPIVSVVTVGELRSLAMQWKWGDKKLSQVDFALGFFQNVSISNDELIRSYALIDAHCESIGQPLGKNDLWIAATAASLRIRLLTTDRDFDRLAPQFFARDWIDPDTHTTPK